MKTAFKELHQWAKENPVKACLFSALTGILATWQGTHSPLTALDLIPWLILIIGVVCTMASSRIISVLLALCLLIPAQPRAAEKPQSAAVAAAVVVIIVGGVVVFKLVSFCQKAFPKTENPPTNNVPKFESTDYYAASLTTVSGFCYEPSGSSSLMAVEAPSTVMELSGGFVDTGDGFEYRMTGCRKVPEADCVGFSEFEASLTPWGIRLGGVDEAFYGLNGNPCNSDQVPITFGSGAVVNVARGDWVQTVVFEKSNDLMNWEAMLTMTISAEQRVKFSDAGTAGQTFYRCRPL